MARGFKYQLLIDITLKEDVRKRKKNLNAMWTDYKQAYNSVPYSWMTKVLTDKKVTHNCPNIIIHNKKLENV